MSVDVLETSWDQCRSMVQYSFTSTETRRLVRSDSPGRPPGTLGKDRLSMPVLTPATSPSARLPFAKSFYLSTQGVALFWIHFSGGTVEIWLMLEKILCTSISFTVKGFMTTTTTTTTNNNSIVQSRSILIRHSVNDVVYNHKPECTAAVVEWYSCCCWVDA